MAIKTRKKLVKGSPEYERRANQLARDYVRIKQCKKCTHPCVDGYCCLTCGTGTPDTTEEQDAAWEKKYAHRTTR